jgi:hypothetical protein
MELTMSKLDRVNAILDLCRDPLEPHRLRDWFTSDFSSDRGFGAVSLDDFLSSLEVSGGWSGLRTLGVVESADDVALFFEALDRVTGLRYRLAWLFRFRGDLICALIRVEEQTS